MTESGKLLTIVVPVYNRQHIVRRTLDSIASQSNIDKAEIILVDNNSKDDTLAVLRQWAEAQAQRGIAVKVLTEPKPGAAAARNRGLREAVTSYISFFDSDDEMLPGFIEKIIETLTAHPDAELIGWDMVYDTDGKTRVSPFPQRNVFWDSLIHGSLCTLHYAAATDLVRRAGCWNETLRQWDDYELGVRLMLQRPKVVKVADATMTRAIFTETSYTGNGFVHARGEWEKTLDRCADDLREAGLPTDWIDVRRVILAGEYRREGRKDYAKGLLAATLKPLSASKHAIMRLLYAKHCLYPRGTGLLATIFFSKKL